MRSDEFILVCDGFFLRTTASGLCNRKYFWEVSEDCGIPLSSSVGVEHLKKQYPEHKTQLRFMVIKNTDENIAIVREFLRTKNTALLFWVSETL